MATRIGATTVHTRSDTEFVVASADVLNERVTANDHIGRPVVFEFPHRSQSGFEPAMVSFDPVVRVPLGVILEHPAGVTLGLHYDPERAAALHGFDVVGLCVPSRSELEAWSAYLAAADVEHTPITEGHLGWVLRVADPDGILGGFTHWTGSARPRPNRSSSGSCDTARPRARAIMRRKVL